MSEITGRDYALSEVNWLCFLPSVLMSVLTNYFIFSILGTVSFWIGDVWSILYVMGILFGFFSGQFYPLHMDSTLEYWSRWFPF